MDRGMDADGQMDGWMDRWMDGWMDSWIDGWMDGWMAQAYLAIINCQGSLIIHSYFTNYELF